MPEGPESRQLREDIAVPLMPRDQLVPEEPDAGIDGDQRRIDAGVPREVEALSEQAAYLVDRVLARRSVSLAGHQDEPGSGLRHEGAQLTVAGQTRHVVDDASACIESRSGRSATARVG